MAIAQLADGVTLEQYQQVQRKMADEGIAVPGRILQICFGDKDNVQILNVWESAEAAAEFMSGVLGPLLEQFGLTGDVQAIENLEVHKLTIA